MPHALFDILTGNYQNGQTVNKYSRQGDLPLSIGTHLQRLLNGRRGVLPHLPEYGMPDIAALFEALPHSLDDLTAALRQTIEQFEHRLTRLQIRPRPATVGADRVRFDLAGYSHCGQPLKFTASLYCTGKARVELQAERGWHG